MEKLTKRRIRLLSLSLILSAIISAFSINLFAQASIEIVNNQPFAVKMPIAVKNVGGNGEAWRASDGRYLQKSGDEMIFVADVPASSSKSFSLKSTNNTKAAKNALELKPTGNELEVIYSGSSLGKLSWQIVYRDSSTEEKAGNPYSTKKDFSAAFAPTAMKYEKVSRGVVFDTWRGVATSNGLELTIEFRIFHDGFLDLKSTLKNASQSKVKGVYAAVLTRWQQPDEQARTVCYDNRIAKMADKDYTLFRVGESRNWYIQRGIDWLKTDFAKNVSATWMNDFSQNFTVHLDATAKKPGRWVGANIAQIGSEAQSNGEDLYLLTEIARSNLKFYAERLEDNRLMNVGDSANYTSRIAFNQITQPDSEADNAFVAYSSYASQQMTAGKVRYQIGVPYTRFGTNYFPYSTLGENFDRLKMPGMDRDAYWPLAADTVKNWRLFADDIRRDLRIAKTLGFELIRLHHLELIQALDKKTQYEYLDFLFDEMRKLKLKTLIDARVSATDTAELVKRYRDNIDGVEVDNEVLIFGINDDAPDYWRRVYNAVKEVAPEIPVHLTAHTNTGAFDRIQQLGVKFDKVGQHAYSDGLDSQANMRGFSLAAASYARRIGKEPIITEWNWRFLTRLTEEDRAKVYSPIFENVLKTRSMPTMYQFQFNESLAMNPRALKGIRHYEQIWMSRRPKPEAFIMADLINKYSAPNHPNRQLNIEHSVVELAQNGTGTAQFKISNTSKSNLDLAVTIEAPANLKANFADSKNAKLSLKQGETKTVSVSLAALPTDNSAAPLPGFYHVFLRLENGDLLRYGWGEARLTGQPRFDKEMINNDMTYGAGAMDFNVNRPVAVVYGDNAPIQDVETAFAIVNALESATGQIVKIYEQKDLPKNNNYALILVGTDKTNPLISAVASKIPAQLKSAKQYAAKVTDGSQDVLVFSGADQVQSELAAMDWTVRFWKYAKDSAARRTSLVEKDLPLGVDPTGLP